MSVKRSRFIRRTCTVHSPSFDCPRMNTDDCHFGNLTTTIKTETSRRGEDIMSEPAAARAAAAPGSSDAQRAYAHMIWNYRNAEEVAAMIFVGDHLGLFKAMAGAGPLSAEDLAARTGLHPRWLLEWMRLQAAGRVLFYRGDDRFELPAEANDVLVDSDSAGFA